MTHKSKFSLKGCKTRDEAAARYRAWLEELQADRTRKSETELQTQRGPDAVDIEDIDDFLSMMHAANVTSIDESVAAFRRVPGR
jgi:hypothetical protein